MSDILKELDAFPDPMSKVQFCRACHICYETASYLINAGLVPASRGSKAGSLIITKASVREYLGRRAVDPDYYHVPAKSMAEYKRTQPAFFTLRSLDFRVDSRKMLKTWITKQFSPLPDLLRTMDVGILLGYRHHTIIRWCTENRFPNVMYRRNIFIPKSTLVDYMVSDTFNKIIRKSELHYKILQYFHNHEDVPEWKDALEKKKFYRS